ncbi:hypothetical protein COCON_G00113610 [Conger conger]|uniref:RBR-type E3 ubiquitin transferase n=1 Tax=Conger conger TaxID=82655 RepID=A0A9Q1DFD1_CONCO|nr:hypothetical protein COCON_G00113610 [Conger conger]
MTTEQQEPEKRYNPRDSTLRFVTRQDDITLDDDPDTLRAEMSLLDQGQHVFRCPALKDGTVQKCGAEWPYQEVRKLAVLTAAEQGHFETALAALARCTEHCEFKSCPGCQTCVERADQTNLCVRCTVCSAETGRAYEFCWQCLQLWKGPAPRFNRCDNQSCTNKDLELLEKCKTTSLHQVEGVSACPSLRACPTCGQVLEHDRTGCKNILCSRCQVEFCFVCLKLTPVCLDTSSHFRACKDGVAPRQTSIPSWNRSGS